MGRPRSEDPKKKYLISLPESLVLQVDLLLPVDYLREKPLQGARSQLVERLLREWIAGLAIRERESYNNSSLTQETENGSGEQPEC